MAIVVVKFVHNRKVAISHSDYDDRNRQSVALNDQVDYFLAIMYLSISDNIKNHVLVVIFYELATFLHGLFKEFRKFGRTAQTYTFKHISVLLHYLFNAV